MHSLLFLRGAAENPAHDAARGRTLRRYFEASLSEGGNKATVIKDIRISFLRLARITLKQPGATARGMLRSGLEHRKHQALPPIGAGNEEACDRPGRLRIDWLMGS